MSQRFRRARYYSGPWALNEYLSDQIEQEARTRGPNWTQNRGVPELTDLERFYIGLQRLDMGCLGMLAVLASAAAALGAGKTDPREGSSADQSKYMQYLFTQLLNSGLLRNSGPLGRQ